MIKIASVIFLLTFILVSPDLVLADAVGFITPPTGSSLNSSSILNSLVGVIVAIAGLIFFFMLLVGGIRYMTAGGDPKNAESARKIITNALLGLLIVVAAYLITTILGELLGIDFLNPDIPGL
jgi:Type IV secretion system pilin